MHILLYSSYVKCAFTYFTYYSLIHDNVTCPFHSVIQHNRVPAILTATFREIAGKVLYKNFV